ncbi:MAG: hypothetical protein ACJZ8V_01960 [Paracoccaceae bacterium]
MSFKSSLTQSTTHILITIAAVLLLGCSLAEKMQWTNEKTESAHTIASDLKNATICEVYKGRRFLSKWAATYKWGTIAWLWDSVETNSINGKIKGRVIAGFDRCQDLHSSLSST